MFGAENLSLSKSSYKLRNSISLKSGKQLEQPLLRVSLDLENQNKIEKHKFNSMADMLNKNIVIYHGF